MFFLLPFPEERWDLFISGKSKWLLPLCQRCAVCSPENFCTFAKCCFLSKPKKLSQYQNKERVDALTKAKSPVVAKRYMKMHFKDVVPGISEAWSAYAQADLTWYVLIVLDFRVVIVF